MKITGKIFQYINNNYFDLNIKTLIGFENNKNNNKKKRNEKSISINLENESSENLSIQSKDNNTKGTDDNKSPDLIDKQISHLLFNFYNYDFNENKDKTIKKIILRNTKKNIFNQTMISNIQKEELCLKNNYLDEAIKHFKKILVINRINVYSNSTKCIYEFFFSFVKDDVNIKYLSHKKIKIPNNLIISTYLNILFCLSLKNNWLEIIFVIEDFNKKKLTTNKIIILKILLFQLEAYFNLNKQSKMKEIINKIKNHTKKEFALFNNKNNDVIKNINIKLYLYYSITLMHYKEKNYKEMEIYSNKLLLLLQNENNIPYYIIDLLINVFIIKLNNEPNINPKIKYKYNNIILNLIKNKKINKTD